MTDMSMESFMSGGIHQTKVGAAGSMTRPIWEDLFRLLPDLDCSDESGFCVTHSGAGEKSYSDWEREVANPALVAAGYELRGSWMNGEVDGCGILSRKRRVVRNGIHYVLVYG